MFADKPTVIFIFLVFVAFFLYIFRAHLRAHKIKKKNNALRYAISSNSSIHYNKLSNVNYYPVRVAMISKK